jgi:hypothetical protein
MKLKKIFNYYIERQILFKPNNNPLFPYTTSFEGKELSLRINDFPKEPLYTLFVDGQLVGDLDDFPESWCKS